MAQKKDRSRFTIKFRQNDPAHDMTIRILENQGQRNIAPFLVNAVLHYVQCSETPDVSCMLAENSQHLLDRNAIEDIVWGILRKQGILKGKSNDEFKVENYAEAKINMNVKKDNSVQDISPTVKDEMRAMIAKTLSVFRNE